MVNTEGGNRGSEINPTGSPETGTVVQGDIEDSALTPWKTGQDIKTVNATVIGDKDNASSLRVRGLQDPSEGTAKVQNYAGIFHNAAYSNTGTLKTRAIWGGNVEMDIEIQSPHQLRLVAVDDTETDGQVYGASKTDSVFNLRADAEVASPVQLVFDRVDQGTTGTSNTSDVLISANGGNVRYLGIVQLVSFDDTARDAIADKVTNMVIFNTDDGRPQIYNGSTWDTIAYLSDI